MPTSAALRSYGRTFAFSMLGAEPVSTFALHDALLQPGLTAAALHAFDLTPAMLERFREGFQRRGMHTVETVEANVLEPATLPATWKDYDLIISASMLEYVPRERFRDAFAVS